jgi:hypothetical protein
MTEGKTTQGAEINPQLGDVARENLPGDLYELARALLLALDDAEMIDRFDPHPENTAILQALIAAKTTIEPFLPKPPVRDASPF